MDFLIIGVDVVSIAIAKAPHSFTNHVVTNFNIGA